MQKSFSSFLKKQAINDKIIKDIGIRERRRRKLWKPVRVSNFYNSSYIEYESNGDRKKNTISQIIPW